MEPSTDVVKTFPDHENCKTNPGIQKLLDPGEQVIYSCKVLKHNRWGMKQYRGLMLTNLRLYNLKETSSQRKIWVSSIRAISKSIKEGNLEFVVHVKDEYDYRFEAECRDEIFEAVKYVCWKNNKKNLQVFGVPDTLKQWHTSKRDVQEGRVVMPQSQWELKQENVYPEDTGTGGPPAMKQEQFQPQGYDGNMDCQAANQEMYKQRSNTLFVRQADDKAAVLEDFVAKSVIGKGSFGKVFLVQKKGSDKVFAMKSLRKDVILDFDQIESTMLEKQILQKADHPFLVGMEYVFQTDTKLYFVMRFIRGGELFAHLRKARQFPEQRAKFYSLTVALAIGHLHQQKIIYRDLKPENILMGEDGYVCLTDFGLAKILEGDEQTNSFCGTPEYLAPEILEEKGHAFPVDWWALGVLTYEMIVGFPPFYTGSQNNQKMYELIKNKPVFFPDPKRHGITMSPECQDFIQKCLAKAPKHRLGSTGGLDEIVSHPWFKELNVDDMLNKRIKPQFIPKVSATNALDVSQFDKMFTGEEVKDTVLPAALQKKIAKNQQKFTGFDD